MKFQKREDSMEVNKNFTKIINVIIIYIDPLTIDDACSVAKGLEKLSEETLQVVAKYLDMPNFYTEAERKEWRKCMTMILDWESLCLKSENEEEKKEASKKMLAIKIMNAANELHGKNTEDSKALENVARSLNFEGIKYIDIDHIMSTIARYDSVPNMYLYLSYCTCCD